MELGPYLSRIGYDGELAPTLAVLSALLREHTLSVTFENLDVQLGKALTIEPADAFDKIVNHRRGGWCYEQNGLFGWVLSEIGFDVTRVAASVRRAERGEIATANHLCLLVRTDRGDAPYLADVGFGGSMLEPIPLCEGAYLQSPYRLGLRRLDDGWWQFWEVLGDGEFSYDFEAVPADESALRTKCEFLQSDPASSFVLSLVAQRRLPHAHKTLRGRVFSVATENGTETSLLETADALATTLRDHFSLEHPDIQSLWPRIEARHEALMREQASTGTNGNRPRTHDQTLGN